MKFSCNFSFNYLQLVEYFKVLIWIIYLIVPNVLMNENMFLYCCPYWPYLSWRVLSLWKYLMMEFVIEKFWYVCLGKINNFFCFIWLAESKSHTLLIDIKYHLSKLISSLRYRSFTHVDHCSRLLEWIFSSQSVWCLHISWSTKFSLSMTNSKILMGSKIVIGVLNTYRFVGVYSILPGFQYPFGRGSNGNAVYQT